MFDLPQLKRKFVFHIKNLLLVASRVSERPNGRDRGSGELGVAQNGQITEFEPSTSTSLKNCFFWSNPYKIVMITSLIQMRVTKFWSHYHIYKII